MLRDIAAQGIVRFQTDANGILWFYDATRNEWLSVDRLPVWMGLRAKNISGDSWLRHSIGIPSNLLGFHVMAQASIIAAAARVATATTCVFRIRKNGSPTDLATLTLTAVDSASNFGLDIDLSAGDHVQALVSPTSPNKVDYPTLQIMIALRQ